MLIAVDVTALVERQQDPGMTVGRLLIVALAFYIGTYVGFRQTHIEVWERDKQAYVIFPEGHGTTLYYLWRPLTYVDGALTAMRLHIGPHR